MHFVNTKHCKKVLEKRKQLPSKNFTKYQFSSTKIFAKENLTFKNKKLSFYRRKLKREDQLFSSHARNGVVFVKKCERSKTIKESSLKTCCELLPNIFMKWKIKKYQLMRKHLLRRVTEINFLFILPDTNPAKFE